MIAGEDDEMFTTRSKAVTMGVFWVLKHPPKLFAIFFKLANFVYLFSKTFFRLRLLNIGVAYV